MCSVDAAHTFAIKSLDKRADALFEFHNPNSGIATSIRRVLESPERTSLSCTLLAIRAAEEVDMGLSVHQTSRQLLRDALRDALLAAAETAGGGSGIGSVPYWASAALCALLGVHTVDQRGRCRSCRGRRLLLGRRRRMCRVLIAARLYLLHLPDELLMRHLAGELDQPDLVERLVGDSDAATEVLPRIDDVQAGPPPEGRQTPAVSPWPAPGGSPRAKRLDPDHGGAGENTPDAPGLAVLHPRSNRRAAGAGPLVRACRAPCACSCAAGAHRNRPRHRQSHRPPAARGWRAPLVVAVGYRAWGWPVSVRGDRMVLELDRQMVARVIPNVLSEQVRAVLTAHRWPAPVLAYPSLRGSWVVLAGEPFGAPLP